MGEKYHSRQESALAVLLCFKIRHVFYNNPSFFSFLKLIIFQETLNWQYLSFKWIWLEYKEMEMTAQKTQVILYFQPVLSTSLNNKHQSMLLRTLKCKGGFQHFIDNETQTKKSFVTAAVWLLPTKEGWPALVSMRMSPYSTVLLPQFTAQCAKLIHSLKILQRDEFQTVETPVTEFICKFICKYYITCKLWKKLDLLHSCYIWQHC